MKKLTLISRTNSKAIQARKILVAVTREQITLSALKTRLRICFTFLDGTEDEYIVINRESRKERTRLVNDEDLACKQVSVNKKALRKKEQREKFIQEVSEDSSTKCSNTMGEPGSNSLDVCLKQSVRSYDFSAVKIGTTFSLLYKKLLDAEDFADRAVQEAIICYCQFRKALIQRRSEIASEKQVDSESNAVSRILNIEVRAQLPADTSDVLLWKRINSISKMMYEDIQYIIDNIPVDYSIKIESSTCAQPKDTLLSNEKNSELLYPDLGLGNDKKNSELSYTNTSEE
ncbi:13472_t:CDS:2 [Funneliformis mosseae]|uniref:13472_t:CDS:1 n=1 Tax=Funneliformis mosseae TaxID=27381 RepID=A0A9N9BXN5_FUNMO|nr:13472_t:CDS:2 [Funneliformis mosseae]